MSLSAKNTYATAKLSTHHVLDQDFLYGFASNKHVDYIYHGADKSVILNLAAISDEWDVIKATLEEDGFDSDCTPNLSDIIKTLVAQKIMHIEFHLNHSKLTWHNWFTPDTFMEIKPIGYDKPLFAFGELPEEQQKQTNKLMTVVSLETLTEKIFTVVGNGRVVKVDNKYEMVREPDEIKPDYDRLIITPTKERLVLKVNEEKNTVSIAMIMN